MDFSGSPTIVEVWEQSPDKEEIECSIIYVPQPLSAKTEFFPAVTPMAECLIHPNDVHYPLPSIPQLKLFSHKDVAEVISIR